MLIPRYAAEGRQRKPATETDRARDWLLRQITRGRVERFTEIVDITPELAKLMLARNDGNRPLRELAVQEHVERIEKGSFLLTHQGVAFTNAGQLNDGQHRLEAIRRAGRPVRMQVTFGCEREEFTALDSGRARTAADLLAIRHMPNYSNRAAIVSILYAPMNAGVRPRPQEVAACALTLDQAILDAACTAGQALRKKRVTATSCAGAAHYWIASRSKATAALEDFWAGLASGENISGPRAQLRDWLMKGHLLAAASRDRAIKRTAAIVLTWNAHLARRKHVKLVWDHAVKLPDVA